MFDHKTYVRNALMAGAMMLAFVPAASPHPGSHQSRGKFRQDSGRSRSEAYNAGVMKRPYRYVCQRSGTIKAFKQMTASRAEDLNRKLAATGGEARWIPTPLEGSTAKAGRPAAGAPPRR